MGHPFVPVDRATPFLLPPSLQAWLPEHHLARFVVEVIDQLDLRPLDQAYARGRLRCGAWQRCT